MTSAGTRLFFLHIPKTAGTSVRMMLENRVHADRHINIEPGMGQPAPELIAASGQYDLLAGHLPYKFVDFCPQRPFVLTFLRDPIERTISHYYYVRSLDDATMQRLEEGYGLPGLHKAKTLGLREFFQAEPVTAASFLGNLQVSHLSRESMFKLPTRELVREDLELAKKNLTTCDFVGLTDRMDQSMQMLSFNLGWPIFDEPLQKMVTDSRPPIARLEQATIDFLQDITRLDYEFYEFGRRLFAERFRSMLSDLLDVYQNGRTTLYQTRVIDGARPGLVKFTFDQPVIGKGWHLREKHWDTWCCWTGPARESWLEFPVSARNTVELTAQVLGALSWEALASLQLFVNGQAVEHAVSRVEPGHIVKAVVPSKILKRYRDKIRLTFKVDETMKPCQIDAANTEERQIGLLIGTITLEPVSSRNRPHFLAGLLGNGRQV